MNKKLAALGMTIALGGGGVAGFVLSQPSLSGAVATPATSTGGAGDSARPRLADRLTEVLQPLVADGTLTQAQLDAVIAKLEAAAPARPWGEGPHRGRAYLETVATTLGMTLADLRSALQEDGATIASVAGARGVDVQKIIAAVVAERTAQINARVADGAITQEQADARLSTLTDEVTKLVDTPLKELRAERRPGRHHRPADTGETPSTTAA